MKTILRILPYAAFSAVFAAVVPAADRLALANRFSKLGLYAEAVKEFEAIAGDVTLPRDEVIYGLAEARRRLGQKEKALAGYTELVRSFPMSRYAPYARLNRALASEGKTRREELELLTGKETPQAVRDLARFSLAPIWAADSDAQIRRKAFGTYLDLAAGKDVKIAAEATFQAAMLAYREGNYAEAGKLFERLAKNFPASDRVAESATYAAWSAYLAGHYAEALATAARALEGRGRDAAPSRPDEDALYLKAASLRMLERRTEARAAYGDYVRHYPKGRYADSAWTDRLALKAADRDFTGVLVDLAARGDWTGKAAGRAFTYGYEAANAVGKTELALEYARRAQKQGGETGPRALYSAALYESRLGNGEQAMADWTRLLVEYPDSPLAADALHARGMEELRAKKSKAAYASFNELKRRFPKRAADAETLYWHGVAARGADDAPEAERLLRAALAAQPDPATARDAKLELAFILEKKGEKDEAAKLLADLVSTKAVDRMGDATLAWVSETLGNAEAAVALEKRTKDPAWRQIAAALAGSAYAKQGKRDAAKAAFARAVAVTTRTKAFATAALGLGRLESEDRAFDLAKEHLSKAAESADPVEGSETRLEAYMALGVNEERRGDDAAALGYWLLAGSLFDDAERSPAALKKAAAILEKQGKKKEAEDLRTESLKRYGR